MMSFNPPLRGQAKEREMMSGYTAEFSWDQWQSVGDGVEVRKGTFHWGDGVDVWPCEEVRGFGDAFPAADGWLHTTDGVVREGGTIVKDWTHVRYVRPGAYVGERYELSNDGGSPHRKLTHRVRGGSPQEAYGNLLEAFAGQRKAIEDRGES